eukprot:1655-Chlamydomonas_euryale.AAC.1
MAQRWRQQQRHARRRHAAGAADAWQVGEVQPGYRAAVAAATTACGGAGDAGPCRDPAGVGSRHPR